MTKEQDHFVQSPVGDISSASQPAWLWDIEQGRILWANFAAIAFWDEDDLPGLYELRFDRAMPGLSRLRCLHIASSAQSKFTEDLLFWTKAGARKAKCHCQMHVSPDGQSGILVTVLSEGSGGLAPVRAAAFAPDNRHASPLGRAMNGRSIDGISERAALDEIAHIMKTASTTSAGWTGNINRAEEKASRETGSGDMAAAALANGGRELPPPQCADQSIMRETNDQIASHDGQTGVGVRANGQQPDETFDLGRADWFAKISHEVRTPLNSIIGFSELMKEESFGPVGHEKYKGYVEDIHLSAQHALSLINDLLDISKIKAGAFDIDLQPVSIDATLEQCASTMQPMAQKAHVTLKTSIANSLPLVAADLRTLKQIVLNLLSNAIKFTQADGSVTLSSFMSGDGEVIICVQDTGIGMLEDEIMQALKPFRQLDTAPRHQTGTGLGLPLAKVLTEANGASFAISSEAGLGTRVEITFNPVRHEQH